MTDLPYGWEWATVGSIAESLVDGPFGSNLKTEHYQPTGVRVIRLQNIADGRFDDTDRAFIAPSHAGTLSRHEVRSGDLLIAAMGDVLPRVCLAPPHIGRAIVKADCFRLRPRRDVSAAYISYVLSAPQTRKRASTQIAGVGRPRLNLRKVAALEIPIPSIAEQGRIVAVIEEQFSRLDAGIDALRRSERNLTLFRDAIAKEALSLSAPMRPLGEICVTVTDGDHQPPPQVPEGIPFLVIGNVRTGNISIAGCRYVPAPYYESLELKRRPRRGDVLYTTVGSYGIPALVRDDQEFCVQRHIAILRPSAEIEPAYLTHALRTSHAKRQADSFATGTAQKTVPLSGLRRMAIPVPSYGEQHAIAKKLDEYDARIAHFSQEIRRQLQRSTILRSAILAAAFSGNLIPQSIEEVAA